MQNDPEVPCDTCGTSTKMTGTRKCNACWEVESRLDDYVRRGSDRARRKLLEASGLWEPIRSIARTIKS